MPSSPQYKNNFAISDDGVITAIGELNRETKANYSFVVRAMDLDPDHPRYNSTVVEIKVLDANDNPPVFRQASYVAELPEHSNIGFVPLQVNIVVDTLNCMFYEKLSRLTEQWRFLMQFSCLDDDIHVNTCMQDRVWPFARMASILRMGVLLNYFNKPIRTRDELCTGVNSGKGRVSRITIIFSFAPY